MTVYTDSCEWISALEVCPLDQATKNFQNIMFDRIKFYLIQYVIEMKLSQNASEVGRWGHHITFITLSTDETSVIKKKQNCTSEQRRPKFCSQNWKMKYKHCSFSELFSQFSWYFQSRSETGVQINLPCNKIHFSSERYFVNHISITFHC